MGIRRVTSSAPLLAMMMRVGKVSLKTASGTDKFINIPNWADHGGHCNTWPPWSDQWAHPVIVVAIIVARIFAMQISQYYLVVLVVWLRKGYYGVAAVSSVFQGDRCV